MVASGCRLRVLLWLVAALTLISSNAVARNFGAGTGYTDSNHAPLFVTVRARLMHEGYRPARLPHDYRDLCGDDDWSRVCKEFPETLDCEGESWNGECDFIFEAPRSDAQAHGPYLLVSTLVTPGGRVAVHQQPADYNDLQKIAARMDLKRKGCGDGHILEIRVCDQAWKSSKVRRPVGSAWLPNGWRRADYRHGPLYSQARARLIRSGYVPAKLEHDDQDFCGGRDRAHVCRRFPESLDCDESDQAGCDFVFLRPEGETAAHGPYLVVHTIDLRRGMIVAYVDSPGTEDVKRIWARKNLAWRGCEDEYLLNRICRGDRKVDGPKPKPEPVMPDLPPLPPSAR